MILTPKRVMKIVFGIEGGIILGVAFNDDDCFYYYKK